MALMTKTIFYATVRKVGDKWLTTTTLPDIGNIESEAESEELIAWHARLNICGYTDLNPFDFELHFDFPGVAPKYYLD